MNLITIKTFDNGIEAHLLKIRLENEGIDCFIFDENIVTLMPLYNIGVGGIKLKINEHDKDKALGIITEIAETKLKNEQNEIINCPKCQSEELIYGFKSMKGLKGIISMISSFIFMIFPIYFKSVNKCKACGHEFK